MKNRICEDLDLGKKDRVHIGAIYHWLVSHDSELATSLSIHHEDMSIMAFPSGTDYTDYTDSSATTGTPAKPNPNTDSVNISQRENEEQPQGFRWTPSLPRQTSWSFPSVKHVSYNIHSRKPNTVSLYNPTILKTLSLWCYSFNFNVMNTLETIIDQLELEKDLNKQIDFNVVRDILVTALQPVVMGNDYRYLNGLLQYMEQVLGRVCILNDVTGI